MGDSSLLKQSLESLRDNPDKLIEIILRQAERIETLNWRIEELEEKTNDLNDRNNGLTSKIEELEKTVAGPAAPFRIKDKHRMLNPQKPGRKPGHPGSYRPVPQQIDEEIKVPLGQCPECGGKVGSCRAVVQYIEELPVVRPKVIKLITEEAECEKCQKVVRSTHPLQVSLAEGAAGVQLGPRALGVAAELNKKHGLTMRKTCAVLEQLFSLKISAGGLAQALARMAAKLESSYENLLARLRAGPYVHSDETGWWVGGPGFSLWVFADKASTVYRVVQERTRQRVFETLGPDYGGVLITDCLSVYDGVNQHQQKCYAHHLKAIGQALEQGPSVYLQKLRALLKAALALKSLNLEPGPRQEHRQALQGQAQQLLDTPRGGLEEKVRLRLWKQRDHLFTFLDFPEVDATNNLAERQLRPAVISRKVSCGNKTLKGAAVWEILTSLAATCTQRKESFAQLVSDAALLNHPR